MLVLSVLEMAAIDPKQPVAQLTYRDHIASENTEIHRIYDSSFSWIDRVCV